MIEIRRILCPIDFSEFSRLALDHAVAIAERYESDVTLLYVYPLVPGTIAAPALPLTTLPVSVPTAVDLETMRAEMKRFAASENQTSVKIECEIGEGNPASEILARANMLRSDLIVMGTHGRSGFERLTLGSVTEKVIRKATCPVLTVPPRLETAPAGPVRFTRILCGVDFSEASLRALEYAVSLTQDAETALTLVHVVEVMPVPKPGEALDTEAKALGAYVTAAADARAEHLQGLVPANLRPDCTVKTMVAIGSAHREILRVATEQASDLIVLGAHGFGLSQFLFGSAAHQVVRQARCPVLTIR